ncbi:molybdenum cofactor guanylyltransferase MobA [Pseudovibrio flavus]|uniref:molybdenum cofactor guanylyltransferase MobA n=1 Tax=Pseudovibrio flavus TaxID=2529854 RepID=UPI00211C5C75|nr:molybdenum cofactor guanylyltransferase MobA [Pseudovibrio flavus]
MSSSTKPEHVVGCLLAGGRSLRMGGNDKSLALLGGTSLLEHVYHRLNAQLAHVALSSNHPMPAHEDLGIPILHDPIADFPGPLAGILAGLRWAQSMPSKPEFVFSVAVDTPFFPMDAVETLLKTAGRNPGVPVVSSCLSRAHPTCTLWPVSLADTLQAYLDAGERRLMGFCQAQEAVFCPFPPIRFGEEEVDPFFNINDAESMHEAETILESLALGINHEGGQ